MQSEFLQEFFLMETSLEVYVIVIREDLLKGPKEILSGFFFRKFLQFVPKIPPLNYSKKLLKGLPTISLGIPSENRSGVPVNLREILQIHKFLQHFFFYFF